MRKSVFEEYQAPDIEVAVVSVESGFAFSNLENIEGENPEQEW